MKKRIVVIEDNLEVRENLVEILELANYEVHAAENGKLGVEKVIEVLPDLVLCDVMMPVLDGFGVLKIISGNPDVSHIPLIFLTAKTDKADFRKGMSLGAEDYITKPFDDTDLFDAIEMRLKKAERYQKADLLESKMQHFFSKTKAQKAFRDLYDGKELRRAKHKELIYEEGQNAHWLYYLEKGKIKLYKTNDYSKELVFRIIKEGDYFGYFPLIVNNKYGNSAACLEDCEYRIIPKEDFLNVLFNNKDFSAQFIKMISFNTSQLESQLIEMAYGSVRKKVANALIAFATKNNDSNSYYIEISRENLSSVAGVAKETLIRTLGDFKREDLIELESKKIKVLNKADIENIIG